MTCPGSLPGFSGRAGISTVFWFPSSGLVPSAAQPCLFRECHLEEVPLRWVWKAMQVSGEECWEGHSSWEQHVRRLGPGPVAAEWSGRSGKCSSATFSGSKSVVPTLWAASQSPGGAYERQIDSWIPVRGICASHKLVLRSHPLQF